MAGSIFISYRRADSKADARSIYQSLERTFGASQLFMDVDTIEKGRDFRKALEETLANCQVMLTIIGPNWLEARNDAGAQRLDNAGDYVLQEIVVALKRNIPVIPVLVNGARLPREADLPGSLKGLALRQAAIVTHENFQSDMAGLEGDIRALMKPARPPWQRMAAAVAALLVPIAAGSYYLWPMQNASVPAPKADLAAKESPTNRQGPASKTEPSPTIPRPQAGGVPANECDRRAAARFDREAVAPGVSRDAIAATLAGARRACEDAVRTHPSERRFAYQLARVEDAAGEFDKARVTYAKLADDGYPAAMYSLALLHFYGWGTPKDIGEGNLWLRQAAASAGHAEGMYLLARHLEGAVGFATYNHVEAVEYYRKAAAAGHMVALTHLAGFQYAGFGGLPRDPAEASRLYFKALESGDAEVHYNVHQFGFGNLAVGGDFIRELKTRLKEAGVYNGAIDGNVDPPLTNAIVALKAKVGK